MGASWALSRTQFSMTRDPRPHPRRGELGTHSLPPFVCLGVGERAVRVTASLSCLKYRNLRERKERQAGSCETRNLEKGRPESHLGQGTSRGLSFPLCKGGCNRNRSCLPGLLAQITLRKRVLWCSRWRSSVKNGVLGGAGTVPAQGARHTWFSAHAPCIHWGLTQSGPSSCLSAAGSLSGTGLAAHPPLQALITGLAAGS